MGPTTFSSALLQGLDPIKPGELVPQVGPAVVMSMLWARSAGMYTSKHLACPQRDLLGCERRGGAGRRDSRESKDGFF